MKTVIGLEIHAQLQTKTKLFCGCSADYFGKEPNTNTCPVCLGMPGALPVLNKRAVEYGIKTALALSCDIPDWSKFDRKNYFYPDLPKGYQISQYDKPLAKNGHLIVDGEDIRLRRIHLEEDAGKLIHRSDNRSSVDLNRVGVPLIEIVTEPDIKSPEQARSFMEELRLILQYLEVCSGDMEKGSLRCDANLSVTVDGKEGTKTEVKNMNSFKAVEQALKYEEQRQKQVLSEQGTVEQVTLAWDADSGEATVMRSKEEAHDYRYFPEPDLTPLSIDETWKDDIRSSLPELPREKRSRWKEELNLPDYNAQVLTQDPQLANYFEDTLSHYNRPKSVSDWIMSEALRVLKLPEASLSSTPPEEFAELVKLVDQGEINQNTAKDVLEEVFTSDNSPSKIIERDGLRRISDEGKLAKVVEEVIGENGEAVSDYLEGRDQVLGFLIGQVMQKTEGQADPAKARSLLQEKLEEAGENK
ncbi:MAG: Asp-tRNA(Asn)/Glu-tRNA(Gln) amidotransferase subunit GatB [Candidatus Bipolaricaulota bacterium]